MHGFKLGFRNKSASEQLVICERTTANLKGRFNDEFNKKRLVEATETVSQLRDSHERIALLRKELSFEISNRKQLLATARNAVTNLCVGLAARLDRNPAKLLEAGLELRKPRSVPVGKPSTVTHLQAETTGIEGQVRLRFKRPLRRCGFEIQCRPDTASGTWKTMKIVVAQTCGVDDLRSGAKYWFRVRAFNAHGTGPWSNPVAERLK